MAEVAVEREVERNFRWNFSVNLVDISFIMFGLSLVSRETVIPLLMSQLTDSTIVIGLLPAVYSLGIYLPQLISARYSEAMPLKKPFVALFGGVGERLPYLLIGLVVLFLAESAPIISLALIILLFGISGASAGFATPAWFDMIAKVIPVRRRGLFSGVGHGLGALMGVAGAVVIGVVLDRWAFPQGYALLFVLAFVAMTISWIGLVLNREPASPSVNQTAGMIQYLRRLPRVLRADTNFARYLASMVVGRVGTMAGGFFLVYGAARFQIGGPEVGLLTGLLIGSQALLNPLWGVIGDRYGHKVVLVFGSLTLALAPLAAAVVPTWHGLIVAFLLLGAFLAAETASFLTIIPEFCSETDRPTYIGLTNTILAPVTTLAPLLGGWLAAVAGFSPMFIIATVVATIGTLMLLVGVREPRHHGPAATA
ncbi:MAG TPA: MFS transporter [Roseiflexaceae bacterium]|nr:MFS transporter [Roseiflexaceae bacterium]